MLFFKISVLAFLAQRTTAARAEDWRARSIYQVFTDRFARTDGSTTWGCDVTQNVHCGGTWRGIENRLDYIAEMGFTAIWISPVTSQVADAYHAYYQTDLYGVHSPFGTTEDLKSLSKAVHDKGMMFMVDVVPNHMGWKGCSGDVDYSQLKPFDKPEYYHPYCFMQNYQNQTQVEQCWIGEDDNQCYVQMPDLKTEDPYVAGELNKWIQWLVTEYSIDGLRIDSVKNVNAEFFQSWCAAAGVFCMGEVSDGQATYTYPYQHYLDSVLDYPLYYAIKRVFRRTSNMADLVVNMASCTDNAQYGCKDSTLMGTFFENHDNERLPFGQANDLSLIKNALGFATLGDGIPVIYQGQEQHFSGGDDPHCREALWDSNYNTESELYKHIKLLNNVRNHAAVNLPDYLSYQARVVNYTEDVIQLRKDEIRTIFNNQGSQRSSHTMTTSGMEFVTGETVVDVITCRDYSVDYLGEVEVQMGQGQPIVLVPECALEGSSICGYD